MAISPMSKLIFKRLGQILVATTILPDQMKLWSVLRRVRSRGIIHSPFDLFKSQPVGGKHLGCYAAKSFSATDRLVILHHTYSFLDRMRNRSLDLRLCEQVPIWSLPGDGPHLAVWMGPSSLAPMEGEAELVFKSNEQHLFTLSFSVAPGWLLGTADQDAILIGGLQGALACRSEHRDACKKLQEVSPQDMLVITIRALARVLGIRAIAAVSAELHVAQGCSKVDWRFDYDGFWERIGAVRSDRGFYVFSPDVADRPAHEGSSTHKSRARRKRRFRLMLQNEVDGRLRLCLTPRPAPLRTQQPAKRFSLYPTSLRL